MVDASMWRHLVQPKPRDEFDALREKLKTIRATPPPLVDLALSNCQVKWSAHIIDALLDNWDDWQAVPHTHPERERHLGLLQKEVDGELQAMRRRVYLMQLTHFRRFYAACKLQAIVLKWLYSTGPDGLPPISRHDLLENFIVATGADATIGELGDGDGDEAEEVPVRHPSPHPAKPSRRSQPSLPLLP